MGRHRVFSWNLIWLTETMTVLLINQYCAAIPYEEFIGFPFGEEQGDQFFPRILDHSIPIRIPHDTLPFSFPFFGENYPFVIMNVHGALSFQLQDYDFSQYIPMSFPLSSNLTYWAALVAPYWSDVDIRVEPGRITYRVLYPTNSTELLSSISKETGDFLGFQEFSANWGLIVTWSQVGYYNEHNDLLNTFQVVIATDGNRSIAIFNYATNGIEWNMTDTDGALAGYNAGDNVTYYEIDGSVTNDIGFIDSIPGNTGEIGKWIFRIDKEQLQFANCSGTISLEPQFIHMLGGTPVTIVTETSCFQENDMINCTFGSQEVPGYYLNPRKAFCFSPNFSNIGTIEFTFTVLFQSQRKFYAKRSIQILPVDRGHEVDVNSDALLLTISEEVDLTWSGSFIPEMLSEPKDVSIFMYEMDLELGGWVRLNSVSIKTDQGSHYENKSPLTSVKIPSLNKSIVAVGLIPIIFSVCVNFGLQNEASKKWTGIFFLQEYSIDSVHCNSWLEDDVGITSDSLNQLLPCPPTRDICELPNSGFERDRKTSILRNGVANKQSYDNMWWEYFHPNISACFRPTRPNSNGHGQHCCYLENSTLMIGQIGGGSVDSVRPNEFSSASIAAHHKHDLLPFIYCCKSTFPNCKGYFEKRPSDRDRYVQPELPACIYGDPHLVTLDGHKYTFNGKGEYILVQAEDDSFTIQGRMEQATNIESGNAQATVFTALVAKQNDSASIQFQLLTDLTLVVNGNIYNLENGNEALFENVQVTREQENRLAATFTSGCYMSIERDFDSNNVSFVSSIVISLSQDFKRKTKGLLGNFNDEQEDDFQPRYSDNFIPLNSSIERIHWDFGVSWIIANESESLFYYTRDSWSTYFDANFTPTFEIVFSDPTLEGEAIAICQGDIFCLYDIAATGDKQFGLTTLTSGQLLGNIYNASLPVFCDPPCENGVCVANNTCACANGYRGPLCTEIVFSECDQNMCGFGSTCTQHAGTYMCICRRGYSGDLCNEGPDISMLTADIENSFSISRNEGMKMLTSWKVLSSGYPELLLLKQEGFTFTVDTGQDILLLNVDTTATSDITIKITKYF